MRAWRCAIMMLPQARPGETKVAGRAVLLVLLGLLAVVGLAMDLLASIAEAGVTASTGGVYLAVERAGQAGNQALLSELYDVVARLRWPWAVASALGYGVVVAAGVGLVLLLRAPR